MFNIVLYQPEIPPNTGNIIRLCANTGMCLHLIEPLGFELDHRELKRAGLDYHEYANLQCYSDMDECLDALGHERIYACSTRASTRYDTINYQPNDALLFGPETRGLPDEILYALPPQKRIKIPMQPNSRSLNLSNAVAIIVYEAWRQNHFTKK